MKKRAQVEKTESAKDLGITEVSGEAEIARKELESKQKALAAEKQISPQEAQALAGMRKGAEEGTMDVEALNRQMAQPLYQQGQAQKAEQLGLITQQGLEGSVIAQEASRKVGADVRASIAEQARQIAFKNEQTKSEAQSRLQDAQMKRGELLRNIAAKQSGLEGTADIIDLREKLMKDLIEKGSSAELQEALLALNIQSAEQAESVAYDMLSGGGYSAASSASSGSPVGPGSGGGY